jgi:ribosomal protein S24E
VYCRCYGKNFEKLKYGGCVKSTTRGSVSMNVKIDSKEQNPLLKRKEISFTIEHEKGGGTPSRAEVRKELATKLKTDIELVYVKQMDTKTGTMIAIGEANAYDSIEQANLIEPKHIIARNAPTEKPKEEAEEKQIPTPEELAEQEKGES